MKRRLPKSRIMRERERRRLKAAGEWKKARERERYGTLGLASPVRRIDPATGEVIEIVEPPMTSRQLTPPG